MGHSWPERRSLRSTNDIGMQMRSYVASFVALPILRLQRALSESGIFSEINLGRTQQDLVYPPLGGTLLGFSTHHIRQYLTKPLPYLFLFEHLPRLLCTSGLAHFNLVSLRKGACPLLSV